MCRTDLYFLLRYALNRPDIEKQWLFERCREVQTQPDGHLDLWAREHYKSTIITFGKTIQDILASHGEEPILGQELTFGIFSHTRPLAKGFLRQIKQEFEKNEVLKDLFPDVLWANPHKDSPKWSEDDGISVIRKSNPKEQTIEAWGLVDGQPISKHFTRLIYDDVVVPDSVTTSDMMAKTLAALENSFNLGAEGGERRFIGTRYHYNDAYKSMMDRGAVIPRVYPATKDGTVDGEPVLLTKERIAEKRRDQGPFIFGCQLLLNPQADETQGFQDRWLRHSESINRHGLNVYLLFDPANGKKKDNDFTCGWVVGLGPDEKIRILDMVRDRLNLVERTRLVMNWHRKYKPMRDGVRYEKYGKDADIDHIKEEMRLNNYEFDIVEVGGQTPKKDRIRRLIPYFEQGRIILPQSCYYTDYTKQTRDLVHDFTHLEYLSFPNCMHDDMLDALARLLEPGLTLTWPKEKQERKPQQNSMGSGSWMG